MFIFFLTSKLIRVKFDVLLKQFKLNILMQLQIASFVVKDT